mgnify:CR=1 FL=1
MFPEACVQEQAPQVERLIDYDDPPVTEVVLALSFQPLRQLRTPELALLWRDLYATEFPTLEERPRFEPAYVEH